MGTAILWTIIYILWGVIGYILTYKYYNRMQRGMKLALWVAATIVTLFWLLYHYVIFDLVGLTWMIRTLTHTRMEFSSVLLGAFGALIQIATNKKRKPKDFVSRHNGLVLAIFLILPVYVNAIVFPIPQNKMGDKWKDGVCLQTTGKSCSPACAATLIYHYLGVKEKEADVAREVFCSNRGTFMWDVGRYLKKRGLKVRVLSTGPTPKDPPVPSIAGVGLGGKDGISHSIIIMAKTRDTFIIIDPLQGRLELTKERTYQNYYFRGDLLHVTK
jgi:hypothetical protein